MNEGLIVEIDELIALQRMVKRAFLSPEGRGLRVQDNHQSPVRGRGMEFSEVRAYQPQDDIRRMDWRVTARTGRPHIKVYQEERERPVVFLVDFSPSMYFGTRIAFKSVVAARLAALLAWTVNQQGDRVGGLLYSATLHKELPPKLREHGVLSLLAALSDFTKQAQQITGIQSMPLGEELLRLRRVTKPGSIVILISDFNELSEGCMKQLTRLRAHNDVIAYPIADALELAPPPANCYAISNGLDTALLDTRNDKVRAAYQTFCEQRRTTYQSLFKRLCIPFKEVTAKDALLPVIKQTFLRRRGV